MGKLAEIKDMQQAEPDSPQNMQLADLLQSQQEHNRRMEQLMKLTAGCAVGALAAIVVVAVTLVPRSIKTLEQADCALTEVQQLSEQVREADPAHLIDSLESLSDEGRAAMEQSVQELERAVGVLEQVDIQALNTAVENLGKAVAPLARLFGGK